MVDHRPDHPAAPAAAGPAGVPSLEGRRAGGALSPLINVYDVIITMHLRERPQMCVSRFASPQCGVFDKKNKEDSPEKERLTNA